MTSLPAQSLYRTLTDHYLGAIHNGVLAPGEQMPSVRMLMRMHAVNLSAALQVYRYLEAKGWLETRECSSYFVHQPYRTLLTPVKEPEVSTLDPVACVDVHTCMLVIAARGQQATAYVGLSGANGAVALYPAAALSQIASQVLWRHSLLLIQAVISNGHPELQTAVTYCALDMGVQVVPDDVIITHGYIEVVNLALRAAAQPGDTMAVELPTYYGLLQVLESLDMHVVEIPISSRIGMSLEVLEMTVQAYDNIRAAVVMPNLQNPLGSTMPNVTKCRVAAFCDANRIALTGDGTYSALGDDPIPLKVLKAWNHTGNVICCASLSKVLTSGLRLGWMVTDR